MDLANARHSPSSRSRMDTRHTASPILHRHRARPQGRHTNHRTASTAAARVTLNPCAFLRLNLNRESAPHPHPLRSIQKRAVVHWRKPLAKANALCSRLSTLQCAALTAHLLHQPVRRGHVQLPSGRPVPPALAGQQLKRHQGHRSPAGAARAGSRHNQTGSVNEIDDRRAGNGRTLVRLERDDAKLASEGEE